MLTIEEQLGCRFVSIPSRGQTSTVHHPQEGCGRSEEACAGQQRQDPEVSVSS